VYLQEAELLLSQSSFCDSVGSTFSFGRFTDTTILCADIAGFTAWSSVREPAQVFTLLEALYREFDSLANKRKVFKVSPWFGHYLVFGYAEPKHCTCRVLFRSKPSETAM
jgi:class 3 adenylate cyclase